MILLYRHDDSDEIGELLGHKTRPRGSELNLGIRFFFSSYEFIPLLFFFRIRLASAVDEDAPFLDILDTHEPYHFAPGIENIRRPGRKASRLDGIFLFFYFFDRDEERKMEMYGKETRDSICVGVY